MVAVNKDESQFSLVSVFWIFIGYCCSIVCVSPFTASGLGSAVWLVLFVCLCFFAFILWYNCFQNQSLWSNTNTSICYRKFPNTHASALPPPLDHCTRSRVIGVHANGRRGIVSLLQNSFTLQKTGSLTSASSVSIYAPTPCWMMPD